MAKKKIDEAERLRKVLRDINDTIYCGGAPVGTEQYFKIRGLCVDNAGTNVFPFSGPGIRKR